MFRLASILALVALGLPVHAVEMTKLHISVTNLEGKPVDRASVVVRFVEGRSKAKLGKKIRETWELRTNQEGMVSIPEIPEGKVLIQVIAPNYQTFGDYFTIEQEEKTISVKLKPPQPQYSAH
ncbi:MAG TPA: hypothetical protein VKV15_24125 [Bryobacteraceae bacterium]|nr:hypothetical protein [Bryobacteraceae bacterium]